MRTCGDKKSRSSCLLMKVDSLADAIKPQTGLVNHQSIDNLYETIMIKRKKYLPHS